MTGSDNEPVTTPTRISVSEGFAGWLERLDFSFAFTSYQTGQLLVVGRDANASVRISQQTFERAMGLAWDGARLMLAAQTQVWRFENLLDPSETGDGIYDAIFVPRAAHTIGGLDVHEIAMTNEGAPIFVATKFNCLAALHPRLSFTPVWKPPFITEIAKGDRCHLNGVAMLNGQPRYVSVAAVSNIMDGWRGQRVGGGAVVDVATGDVAGTGFSMPHSPRLHGDRLWLIDSGLGHLVRIDLLTGEQVKVGALPGFGRGLSFIDGRYTLVTVSKPRDETFAGLPLDDVLTANIEAPWCGVLLLDTTNGNIVAWLKLDGKIRELFDVVALVGLKCPTVLGIGTQEIVNNVRWAASNPMQ